MEEAMASPPCLPPISGVLVVMNSQVVKPVAFRAVHRDDLSTPYEGSILDELGSSSSNVHSPDMTSGYHSAPLQQTRQSAPLYPNLLNRAPFHRSMPHFNSASKLSDCMLDSGHSSALLPDEGLKTNAELEVQLREKDKEIARLRQTLEDNEHAIIKVYREKEENWRLEMEKLKQHYEDLLQAQEDRLLDCYQEPKELRGMAPAEHDPQHLRDVLCQCRQELDNALQTLRKERACWMKEKAKVLQYQRQLELNYWQICNHNQELLRTVSQVSWEDGWYHSESTC